MKVAYHVGAFNHTALIHSRTGEDDSFRFWTKLSNGNTISKQQPVSSFNQTIGLHKDAILQFSH